MREIEYLGIYGAVSLPDLIGRYPKHRGTPIVRACLVRLADDPGGRVRSHLEELFLPFLDANLIPRPRLNAWIDLGESRIQVDCLWPEVRLVGELDGFQAHGTKRAFGKGPGAGSEAGGGRLSGGADHGGPDPGRTPDSGGRPTYKRP